MYTKLTDYLNEGKISKKFFTNPEFIKDFTGSKVVDAEGKPLMMYHGGSFSGGEFKGTGWFTSNKADAKHYAKQNFGFITSAFLVVKNPLYAGDISHLNIKVTNDIIESNKKRNLNCIRVNKNGIIEYIEANGAVLIARDIDRDGVIDLHNNEILDVVIFNSKQILLPENYRL